MKRIKPYSISEIKYEIKNELLLIVIFHSISYQNGGSNYHGCEYLYVQQIFSSLRLEQFFAHFLEMIVLH